MANDTIGSMTAVIRATAAQFSTDMKQAEASIQSFAEKSKGLSFGEGLELGAGIELFQKGLEEASEAIRGFFEKFEHAAEIKEFAATIGATASELSSLDAVAQRFELSSEQMNNGLRKMMRSIGEAQAGAKEAQEAFANLGLSVEQFRGLTAGEIFTKVADAIRDLKNPADEAAEAVKIFGKAGAELLPIIDEGSAAIAKLAAAARESGAAFTEDQIKALADAQEWVLTVKQAWDGFTNQLAVSAVPAIKAAAGALQDGIKTLKEFAGSVKLADVEAVAMGVAIAGSALAVGKAISMCAELVESLKAIAGAETVVEALSGPGGWITLTAGLAAAAGAALLVDEAFAKIEASAAKAHKAVQETGHKLTESQIAAAEAVKKAAEEAQKAQDKLMKQGEELAKSLRTPMEKYNDTIANMRQLLAGAAISMDTFQRGAAKAAEELIKASIAKDKFKAPTFGALAEGTSAAYVQAAKNSADSRADDMAKQEVALQNQMLTALNQIVTNTGGPAGVGNGASSTPGITLQEANF